MKYLIAVFTFVLIMCVAPVALSLINAKEAHRESIDAVRQRKIDETRRVWEDIESKIDNAISIGDTTAILEYETGKYPQFEGKLKALGYKFEINHYGYPQVSW